MQSRDTSRRGFFLTTAGLALACAGTKTPASPHVPILVKSLVNRRIEQRIFGMDTVDGAGVSLKRIIGQPALRHLDPFILFDRFHSDDPAAYIKGFPDHPHRGFETVTVMLEGAMQHRDSRGNSGLIRGGGAQWMTAGRGLIHSEMPQQEQGLLSGFQIWVNLPAREKLRAPEYQDLQRDALTQRDLGSAGHATVIAGRLFDATGPVLARVTKPTLCTLELEDETEQILELPNDHVAWVYVHAGQVELCGERVVANTLAVLGQGTTIRVRAREQRAGLLLAAAKPLHEPIAHRGPFVMNTDAELMQAFDDYRSGRLAL